MNEAIKKVCEKSEEKLDTLIEQGINSNNLDAIDKLVDIIKDTKEIEMMKEGGKGMYGARGNYREGGYSAGGYGEGYSEGGYGRRGNYREGGYSEGGYSEGNYGRRMRDSRGRYRGHEIIDDMDGAYGEYSESRNYGNAGKKMQSLEYMLESVVEFVKMLEKDAENQEEVQLIKKYTKKLAEM